MTSIMSNSSASSNSSKVYEPLIPPRRTSTLVSAGSAGSAVKCSSNCWCPKHLRKRLTQAEKELEKIKTRVRPSNVDMITFYAEKVDDYESKISQIEGLKERIARL